MDLNKYIDHTLLAAKASKKEIIKLCEVAIAHNFFAVCVNSSRVALAYESLKGHEIYIAATIGFPLGSASTSAKVEEANRAVTDGATELDMVMNIGDLKDGNHENILKEIKLIKNTVPEGILKVIIETCYLSNSEIETASKLVAQAGADYVKTSTGFGSRGASFEDVKLMAAATEGKIKIKASGGIRDKATALEYIRLGVSRIGTSSGIKIIS
ncbi:deoxyribose-phosphate aldolase [Christiangramia aquimixticola]|uniref:deoxyribose-phosphate aldolase n=1 Tax=Christiangramia aquimixticola TaxID=1697558 RepID=UPI003AA81942